MTVSRINFDTDAYGVLIVTNATFLRKPFQTLIAAVAVDLVMVVDEAHHVGSERFRGWLPDQAKYRIALSATPGRRFDDEGTQYLEGYFGAPVIDFSLADALKSNSLTPYYYYSHAIELTNDEAIEFNVLSSKIARLSSKIACRGH